MLDRPRELHALYAVASEDVPEESTVDDIRYEEWVGECLEDPDLSLEGSAVVLHDETPVSLAFVVSDGEGRAASDLTGTLPEYRRRGLARLVKLATIRWAAANGVEWMLTANAEANVGMRALEREPGLSLRRDAGVLRPRRTKLIGMDPLTEPIEGAELREVAGVRVEIVKVGNGRVKRADATRPASAGRPHMRPTVRTERCMHAHIGFLARGHIQGEYADGCTFDYVAPQVVAIDPGHDAWVVGDEEAVLVQFDSEEGTARRVRPPRGALALTFPADVRIADRVRLGIAVDLRCSSS